MAAGGIGMLAPLAGDVTPGARSADGGVPPLRSLAQYATRVLGLLRRRFRAIAAFAALMIAFDTTRAWAIGMFGMPTLDWFERSLVLTGGLMVAAITGPALVEAAGVHGWRRAVATIGATVALTCTALLIAVVVWPGPISGAVAEGVVTSNAAFLMRMGWVWTTAGLLFAVFCHARDRELAAIHAARTATLERAGAERDIVEMRLQVMQARVEPEILFGALADVRASYARDTVAADALLDDLIAYLRAALPQIRKGASTIAREARLAQAYLRVLPAGRDGRLDAELDIDAAAEDEPFPPLVLLPLVHAAADAGTTRVRIRAASAPGERAIDVELAGETIPAGWSDEGLGGVRAILARSLGPTAGVRVARAGPGVMARITWPPGTPGEGGEAAARV